MRSSVKPGPRSPFVSLLPDRLERLVEGLVERHKSVTLKIACPRRNQHALSADIEGEIWTQEKPQVRFDIVVAQLTPYLDIAFEALTLFTSVRKLVIAVCKFRSPKIDLEPLRHGYDSLASGQHQCAIGRDGDRGNVGDRAGDLAPGQPVF